MQEPSLRASRIAIASAIAVAALAGVTGFYVGRATTERTQMAIRPLPLATPTRAPSDAAATRGVLGRAELVALAAAAADAAAAGTEPPRSLAEAVGRRFEIRLPFGCDGPAEEASSAAMRWRYDEASNALRLHVAPRVWPVEDWWSGQPPPGVEAVEGFWIMRPWSSSEGCPASEAGSAATDAEPVTLPGQTLAIGTTILADEDRAEDPDPVVYQSVLRVSEDDLDVSAGFRIRITGRIAPVQGDAAVHCHQPAGPEQRPICLVGMVADEMAIENGADDETLATWTLDRREPSPS